MSENERKFREAYARKLAEAIGRNPDDFDYGVDGIPQVVDKMVPALATGRAFVGPAVKAAARAVGIKPTVGAIREFLAG